MVTKLGNIFDKVLPEDVWKKVGEPYSTPREKLRSMAIKNAKKQGITLEQFEKQMRKNVKELENVAKKSTRNKSTKK